MTVNKHSRMFAQIISDKVLACPAVVAVWLLTWTGDAAAYVDGGTGLLLVQGLLALIGSLIYFIRHPIKAIKEWLNKRRG
jgi:hypothetical protein